jgi:acetyl esterase/lipase
MMKCIFLVGFAVVSMGFADFMDFKMTGAGTDDQWGTLANWEEGAFPTSSDSVRLDKDCHIANGITGFAARVYVGGFQQDTSLFVDAGGALNVGASGILVACSRKDAWLDVSGTMTTAGSVLLGTDANYAPSVTVDFRDGCRVDIGSLLVGATEGAGLFAVNQSGGAVSISADLCLGDIDGSACTATYTISGGALNATRLNTGSKAVCSAPRFEVIGSAADINFTSVSWLGGRTELEFVLDAYGISVLSMTNGGYVAAPDVQLTVDASAFAGDGDILLIDVSEGDSMTEFREVSLSIGYELDYRRGDGVYLVSEPAAVRTRFGDAKGQLLKTAAGQDYSKYIDLRYASGDGAQLLDLYLPKETSAGARPAVLIIHGGGWAIGDKADGREQQFAEFMIDEGYAALSINYTMTTYEGKPFATPRVAGCWPQVIYDCKSALRWMKAHADELGIDPDRIAVMGGSAGGHLSLLTGLSAGNKPLSCGGAFLDQDDSVRCIVDFYGIPDVRRWGGKAFIDEAEKDHPEIWALASPVEHLSENSPPILIVHGTEDPTVNIGLSDEFSGILKEKGVSFEYIKVDGAKHSFGLHPPEQDLTPGVRRFLGENLK